MRPPVQDAVPGGMAFVTITDLLRLKVAGKPYWVAEQPPRRVIRLEGDAHETFEYDPHRREVRRVTEGEPTPWEALRRPIG